jgi:hypothetical protein
MMKIRLKRIHNHLYLLLRSREPFYNDLSQRSLTDAEQIHVDDARIVTWSDASLPTSD